MDHLERDDKGSTIWILGKAFEPPWGTQRDRVSTRGKSDHYESSVNWEDHVIESFQILCKDQRNAKCGIVSIRLADLNTARKVNPLAATSLDWERDPIRGNPFHGNLLFSGNLPKPKVRELAAVVATHVQDNLNLIEPENYDSELATRATRTTTTNKSEHLGFWQRFLAYMRAVFRL